MQQQLTATTSRMVRPRTVTVLRNMNTLEPHLVIGHLAETIHNGRPTITQRLHLSTQQNNTRLIGIHNVVVVASLLILGNNRVIRVLLRVFLLFLSHHSILIRLSSLQPRAPKHASEYQHQ